MSRPHSPGLTLPARVFENTPNHSASSSVTALESSSLHLSDLNREIADDEARMEMYGGDDVRDPPQLCHKKKAEQISSEPSPVTWDDFDPQNPQHWSRLRKWLLTILISVMTINVTFASSAPTSATSRIMEQFSISSEIADLITSVFLLGYVFGQPFVSGPGSEMFGRKPVLAVSMTLYTLFILGQALAPNIQTLLVTRFFSGFFAVAPLSIGGGLLADIWPADGRGPATSLFTASVFLGPVLGPLVGGFVAESSLKWNFIFWIMFMFAAASTLLMLVFLPETYAPVLLQKKARRLRKQAITPEAKQAIFAEHEKQDFKFSALVHRTLFRPFQMLLLEPILVLVTIYLSVVYGVLYALFEALPIIFIERHGFTLSQNGLVFIGVGIGSTLGAALNYYFSIVYSRHIPRWKGFPPAEYRLYGAMVGAPALVIGAFWLGWTGEYTSVPWAAPAVATIVLGFAISLIFMSFLSYLIDTYLMYSASAFAANTAVRSAVGAAFPLFTVQMYTKLGVNWASSLVGFVGLLLAPSPFLFYKYGARIRAGSKFAPCIDLKIAKELESEERHRVKLEQV